jgi:5-oxoprolinase (ATP-hydrolysing)
LRFLLREGSGGEGRFQGGEGVIRELQFLKPATGSILSERRVYEPYGVHGGGPGKRGQNSLKKADGTLIAQGSRAILNLEAGDSIIIETPGGGGWGTKEEGL